MTKLDLHNSAVAFAGKTLDVKTEFDLAQKCVEQFKSEKLDSADFPFWLDTFRGNRERMLKLRDSKPDSARVVKPTAKK